MKVIPIDLSLIDFNDLTFFTGNGDKNILFSLQESINEIGLLNPPILKDKGESYQIITGWKRLISSRELGHTQALSSIYESGEISDEESIKIIYLDNRYRISELELSELIMLFRDLCSLDDEEIINNVLPLFEIPPSRKHLDKFLGLASLEKEIKDSFYRGNITIEQAQMLSELTPESRGAVLSDVILKYRLNNNEARQVVSSIEEIALRDKKFASHVISDIEKALQDQKKGKNELRQQLKRIRYPALSEVEEKYRKAVDDLNLPKEVNLFINQFFEGNDIEFRIKIKSPEELFRILSSLENSLHSGGVKKLINIIKHGHE